MSTQSFIIENWDGEHPRWPEFVRCLEETAPEQMPFVLGEYARHLPCHLFVALQNNIVVGFLRFGIQPIGSKDGQPPIIFNGALLTEAWIHAFAVREDSRRQGIGKALQKHAIARAGELGCYQIASHSGHNNASNHRVKLSLGFSTHYGKEQSIYFLMPLQADVS